MITGIDCPLSLQRQGSACNIASVNTNESTSLQEPVRKRVGGSLAHGDPLARVEALRRNARALLGEKWKPQDDGTLVRKVVGWPRRG